MAFDLDKSFVYHLLIKSEHDVKGRGKFCGYSQKGLYLKIVCSKPRTAGFVGLQIRNYYSGKTAKKKWIHS